MKFKKKKKYDITKTMAQGSFLFVLLRIFRFYYYYTLFYSCYLFGY
jgi:hypothetical protein